MVWQRDRPISKNLRCLYPGGERLSLMNNENMFKIVGVFNFDFSLK